MNTFHKSFMLSFKLPLTSLSAFYNPFSLPHILTILTSISLPPLPPLHKNSSISNLMPTMNSHSFTLTFIPLLPKFYSSLLSTSNLSTSLNLLLFLIPLHCSPPSLLTSADNSSRQTGKHGKHGIR